MPNGRRSPTHSLLARSRSQARPVRGSKSQLHLLTPPIENMSSTRGVAAKKLHREGQDHSRPISKHGRHSIDRQRQYRPGGRSAASKGRFFRLAPTHRSCAETGLHAAQTAGGCLCRWLFLASMPLVPRPTSKKSQLRVGQVSAKSQLRQGGIRSAQTARVAGQSDLGMQGMLGIRCSENRAGTRLRVPNRGNGKRARLTTHTAGPMVG